MNVSMEDKVILVDEMDNERGVMAKHEAHQKALLHRAVSVFVFNSKGEWLLQRRAVDKYHSGGLWTNACCTHPLPKEGNLEAANRRLREEMGMHAPLTELFSFCYKEALDNELTEHELDHVFVGVTDMLPMINRVEVGEYRYVKYPDLKRDMTLHPELYTAWFKMIVERVQTFVAPD